jgi:hypothetical protein
LLQRGQRRTPQPDRLESCRTPAGLADEVEEGVGRDDAVP